jgi:phage shock protein E
LLLDVRSPGEFAGGHIDGAISIPVQELVGRMDELGDKSGEIVVYCQSGSRSAMAKRLLESNGFASVHDLGGIRQW